jgi:hypothetical protein
MDKLQLTNVRRFSRSVSPVSISWCYVFFSQQKELLGSMELLYFADICAGPGGFSEYMLWRKSWHCKGFGFTLKGLN